MEREEIGEWVKGRCGRENGEGRRGGEGGRRGWERELPPVFRGDGRPCSAYLYSTTDTNY